MTAALLGLSVMSADALVHHPKHSLEIDVFEQITEKLLVPDAHQMHFHRLKCNSAAAKLIM